MVDTIYGDEKELRILVEGLKVELNAFKYQPEDDDYVAVGNWCDVLYSRRGNVAHKIKDEDDYDIRAFFLNHYLIDMFSEIKDKFIEYVGEEKDNISFIDNNSLDTEYSSSSLDYIPNDKVVIIPSEYKGAPVKELSLIHI